MNMASGFRVAKFAAPILAMLAAAGCAKLSDQAPLTSAVIPSSQQDSGVNGDDRGSLDTDSSELSGQAREIHYADGVDGPEGRRTNEVGWVPGVEVVGVVFAQKLDVALHHEVNLVLVPEPDACRHLFESRFVCTSSTLQGEDSEGES